jgi:hypothetical protein
VASQKLMTRAHSARLTRVGFQVIIDVLRGRVVVRTASNVLVAFPLVYPNVVDQHFRGECHAGEIDSLPPRRHTQVKDQGLKDTLSKREWAG